MPEFWGQSGYHLLRVTADNRLAATDEFLAAYVRRPEMRPIDSSCAAERQLHEWLLADPRRAVSTAEIAALADPDARENYTLLLAFRDRLTAAPDLETAYLRLFLEPAQVPTPPLFIDQLTHVILRHVLRDIEDPLRARAAELLFRSQRVTVQDGAIMCADEEIVDMHAASGGMGSLGRLLVESNTPIRSVELDVLHETNALLYWGRDERYDTVLELTFGRPGQDALARVLEAWIAHMLGTKVSIQPVRRISDERWVWHVGLDAEASAIMNDLYNQKDVPEGRLAQILALFRLEFAEPSVMRADIAGRPVYLGLAKDKGDRLRLKPQNLLVNLPLAAPA
jgi:hypothetical protein